MSNRPNRRPASATKVARARQGSGAGRVVWIVVGIAVVVLLAAAIAIGMTRSSKNQAQGGGASPSGGTVVPAGSTDLGTVQVDGTPLAQLPTSGGSDPAVGQTIPTVTGQQFDGSPISIAPDGKPKVIMLVAHWCPHCQAEVPRVQQWLDESGMPTDVELQAVATGTSSSKPNYPPSDWLLAKGWSVPTMADDSNYTAANAFGLTSYPFFVVVDSSGKVVTRTSGELTQDQWNSLLDAARTGTASSPVTPGGASSAG